MKSALIVMTNSDTVGAGSGRPTGAYVPEIVDAWWVFDRHGFAVRLASIAGGEPPLEALSEDSERQLEFFHDAEMSHQIRNTTPVARERADDHEIVLFAGGHGAATDFVGNAILNAFVADCHRAQVVLAAVCHGPLALSGAMAADGTPILNGIRVCGFTNAEERAIGMSTKVPVLVEDALRKAGGVYVSGPSFVPHIEVDGRIVTGQNPASAEATAEAAVELATSGVQKPAPVEQRK